MDEDVFERQRQDTEARLIELARKVLTYLDKNIVSDPQGWREARKAMETTARQAMKL